MIHRNRSLRAITLPVLSLAFLPGCPIITPDLGQTTSGTSGGPSDASTSAGDGVDSTGAAGECPPLLPADVSADATLPAGCRSVAEGLAIDHRLELQPGVELRFEAAGGLVVGPSGVLRAIGTAADPVILTAAGEAGWQGVRWHSSTSSDNRLEHVTLDGATEVALHASGDTRLQISNSEISGAAEAGLRADPGAELTLESSILRGNGVPLSLGIDVVSGVAGDNELSDNDQPAARVEGGTLTDAARWEAIGVPLRFTGDAYIEGALELAPGVEIEMPQDARFDVSVTGSLRAEGTAGAPIVMRGQQDERGYWQGLSVASQTSANVLSHCELSNGGASGWNGAVDSVAMVWLTDQAKLQISHCTLRRSGGAAVGSMERVDLSGFADNVIEDNRHTLQLNPQVVAAVEASNAFVDNDEDYVRVGRENANTHGIDATATWAALPVAYRVMDRFYVGAALTVEAGAVVQVMQDRQIVVQPAGSLRAVGTASAPIRFVGVEALPGYWKGLQVESVSASNELRHVEVRHAGSSGFNGSDQSDGALYIEGSLMLADSVVAQSGGHGAVVWEGQLLGCEGVQFQDNAKDDVYVWGDGTTACP